MNRMRRPLAFSTDYCTEYQGHDRGATPMSNRSSFRSPAVKNPEHRQSWRRQLDRPDSGKRCDGCPPSRPGEFHPESLTDPDLILSHHPARATARRPPPSVERRAPPGERLAQINGDDPPP